MKVTVRHKQPIGDFKAIEKTYSFYAESCWKPAGTSLVYFRLDRFNIRTEAESEIVSIEE